MDSSRYVQHITESQKALAGYLYAQLGNWADAEDVLQEVNLRLWEQQDRYDPTRPFLPWARTIAHFMVMAHRSKVRRSRIYLDDDVVQLLADESDAVDERLAMRRDALDHCLQDLSPENHRIVNLCYFGDMAMKEVAAKLQRSEAATYKAVSRIRQALCRCINNRLREVTP